MIIKTTSLNQSTKFDALQYPCSGIYLNIDETGMHEYFFVDKAGLGCCIWLGERAKWSYLFEEFEEGNNKIMPISSNKMVSEEFALKMLSIATKQDKYKEL